MLAEETIFALSSGRGRAGVSVIRLSGPAALAAALSLTQKDSPPVSRETQLCRFYDPQTGALLDRGLLLYFAGPKSFTGEDVVEFHIHGGRAVVSSFLSALAHITNLRSAEPGEFTRRAFDNGKMDLTAAEGLADLINAETETQRQQALRLMDGRLADIYENWRHEIIRAMAYLEADIDFADEEVPEDVAHQVGPLISTLHREITAHLGNRQGERIRDGLQVVILGEPNAGKSTLLNSLSKRDVAIVSDVAGTTRDLLDVHLDLNGFPVTVTDTAGLRKSDDVIEVEGIRRATSQAERADLKIILLDAGDWPTIPGMLRDQIGDNTIILLNKTDLRPLASTAGLTDGLSLPGMKPVAILPVSVKQGDGMDLFLNAFSEAVEKRMGLSDGPLLTRQRHRETLADCLSHLARFLDFPDKERVLQAEDLRMAARSLGAITGRVDVEDILDVVFSEFCIGK